MSMSRWILVAACSLVVGCDSTGCDLCTTSAIVFGRVTNQQAQPVANVPVDVRLFRTTCTQALADGGTDALLPRTDSQGNYEAQPFSRAAPFTAQCVQVVIDPRGQVLDIPTDTVRAQAALELRADYKGPARDSVRVDVQIGS